MKSKEKKPQVAMATLSSPTLHSFESQLQSTLLLSQSVTPILLFLYPLQIPFSHSVIFFFVFFFFYFFTVNILQIYNSVYITINTTLVEYFFLRFLLRTSKTQDSKERTLLISSFTNILNGKLIHYAHNMKVKQKFSFQYYNLLIFFLF